VSGLAFGIDAAAHEGTIDAGGLTIGVAATGLDVVSPAAHARLWERVRANGLIMSEHPFGTAAHPGRFPVRNRIIAAMCEVVVIVEAAITGGAMGTARLASDLHREVFAVPGSRRNPVAEGCNHLIAQGAHCLTDPLDLTVAVGRAVERSRHPAADPTRVPLGADATATLAAFGGEPATLDQLVERVRRPVGAIAGAVRELERAGRVRRSGGRLWPM
jgi:DNA processing protein